MRRIRSLGRLALVAMLAAPAARADEVAGDPFRFRAPEGFIDARTPHGRALEPAWPAFCEEEGVVACTFAPEFEDDGSRAFAYAKLVPGSQPVSDTLLAKLARSMATAIDARDANVSVDAQSFDVVGGHRVGHVFATVRAGGRETRRWVWVMATTTSLAMVTFVAPAASFERWRPAFEASARATEGVVDGVPLFLQALARGQGRRGLLVVLYVLLLALLVRVVVQAASRRRG
jgi:hypothetical protein